MALELFSDEYNYVRNLLVSPVLGVKPPMDKHIDAVKSILGVDGPDVTYAAKLKALHTALKRKTSTKILKSAGIDEKATGSISNEEYYRALVVKFLMHFHLLKKRGGQKVWLFSSPDSFNNFPSDELWSSFSDKPGLKAKLEANKERFSSLDKKHLANATQVGLSWTLKASTVLSKATQKSQTKARDKVKRWFADDTTTDMQLDIAIGKLANGFQKISNTLNSNRLIYTDVASLRQASSGDDYKFRMSEAFVYAGRYEKLPIVYIEESFFAKGGNVLSGQANWARIVVHELTHLDCSTEDKLYGWAGIKPGLNIKASECIVNADSWAYFAADCANALSKRDIERAMKGI